MTTQIKAGVIAANAVNSSELASGALSGQNFTGDVTFDTTTLVIDSTNDRVGIGTASPSTKLHVYTTVGRDFKVDQGTANKTILSNDYGLTLKAGAGYNLDLDTGNALGAVRFLDNGSETMRINSSGNVGINNTNPDEKLHISGGGIKVDGEATIASGSGTGVFLDYASDVGRITALDQGVVWRSLRLNAADIQFYIANGQKMVLDSSGNVGIGGSPDTQLNIKNGDDAVVRIESIGSESGDDARLELKTTNGTFTIQNDRSLGTSGALTFAGNTSDNLVIDHNSGNVGIGETSPANDNRLHVKYSDTGATPFSTSPLVVERAGVNLINILGQNADDTGFLFGDQDDNDVGGLFYFHSSNAMTFRTNTSERMRIDSAGNVGIGQTSPYSHASYTSLSIGGVSSKGGLIQIKHSDDSAKGYLYAQSTALTLESASTNLIRFVSNAANRGAIDSKGTLFFGAGDSSYAHNTYAHAAVFSKNSTPLGTVVIEDSDVSSGIGNTVLGCYLRDEDPATYATFIRFTDGGGTVGSITHLDDGSGVSYNTSSDYRLKENVNYDWDALALVGQLKPAKFNFITKPTKTIQGFLAHEVKDIVPSSVAGEKDHIEPIGTITDSDGNVIYEGVYEHFCKTDEGQTWTRTGEEPIYQQLDYSRLVPLLTKAIQEQQTIIDDLKSRLDEAGL